MAMSLNRAQIIGNVTRDPELRQIPGGQTVVSFSIATNFVWQDSNGQKQEKVEFHNITAWRKLAEIVGQYVKKGSKVFVEGRIQTRDWEGEDGVKRYRTEIVADNVIMLDRKGAGSESEGGFGAMTQERTPTSRKSSTSKIEGESNEEVSAPSEEVTIEDLPF